MKPGTVVGRTKMIPVLKVRPVCAACGQEVDTDDPNHHVCIVDDKGKATVSTAIEARRALNERDDARAESDNVAVPPSR